MRKNLEVEPIDFYSSYSQMIDKAGNTYLCLKNGVIAGTVSCYGNEIDDLLRNWIYYSKRRTGPLNTDLEDKDDMESLKNDIRIIADLEVLMWKEPKQLLGYLERFFIMEN